MAKPKHKSLAKQLADTLSAIEGLRDRILELRHSIDYLENGITLYFAVDFSEVFSYLHLSREAEANVQILGVSLDSENLEQNAIQYRLGLTHLFDSFVHPLYILPSHTQEMWSYVSTQAEKKLLAEDQAERLLEEIRSLGLESKSLLESLDNKEQSQALSEQLLSFVKSPEFAPLCADVSEFVSWSKRARVLKNLIGEGVLSARIEDLLARHNIGFAELKEPSGGEVAEIVSMFPEKNRTRNPFATRIDARALLFLRNLNRLLVRGNARLILVTRDASLLQIAKDLSRKPESEWTEASACLRGIETMFLDLTLTIARSTKLKTKWILESDLLLARLQRSVSDRLQQIRRDGSGSHVSPLVTLGKGVLKETAQLWDQHINVKLSLASDSTTPLGKAFFELSAEQLPGSLNQRSREYQILKNLLEYFSTDIYRTAAVEDVRIVWDGIEIDLLRIQFLDIVGKDGIESIRELLGQTLTTSSRAGATNLYSKRHFKMPPIRLISDTYQDKLRALKTETGEKYEKVLLSIMKEVVVGFNEPEDLFFMAYLLGLLDAWQLALMLTEKCRKMISNLEVSSLPRKIVPSEVDFFLSAIKMRLGRASADPVTAVKLYLSAYQDAGRARGAVPNDARYVMNEAAIAMQYHETKVCLWSSNTNEQETFSVQHEVLSKAEATAQLKRALDLATTNNDTALKIKILNNLAFAEVIADKPAFDEAESYIEQMDDALKNATRDEELLWSGFLVHINDTKLMLKARRAFDQRDLNALRECLVKLELINSDSDLIEHERVGFSSHIEIVNGWINRIEAPE